jgi:hypothetical protein
MVNPRHRAPLVPPTDHLVGRQMISQISRLCASGDRASRVDMRSNPQTVQFGAVITGGNDSVRLFTLLRHTGGATGQGCSP